MTQEWVGVRELGRRIGRKHRAVQRAIEEGRIPASAVRRHPTSGRIVAVEIFAASLAWEKRTDFEMAIRSTDALHLPPPPVQTFALQALDRYDAEALRFSPAYDVAFVCLPAELARAGLGGEAIDRVLEQLYQVMADELRNRGEPEEFIVSEFHLLRERVAEERAWPGSWTT